MTTIIPFAIGAAAILVFGAGWVFGYKSKKPPMCDSCDHLVLKGGVSWKYYCDKGRWHVGFDTPPEYCKAYKPREET